jgi:hypothetical protein
VTLRVFGAKTQKSSLEKTEPGALKEQTLVCLQRNIFKAIRRRRRRWRVDPGRAVFLARLGE